MTDNESVKELSAGEIEQAKLRYVELYHKALPHSGRIDPKRIEVATFNASQSMEEFEKVGLGLETVVIFRDEMGNGHTGKILMNYPCQLLLEHSHVDTFVLKGDAETPPGFADMSRLINSFEGIYKYNSNGSVVTENGKPQFLYRNGEYLIVQADDGEMPFPDEHRKNLVTVLPGKSETFKSIYGDGVLFADQAVVLNAPAGVDPETVPESFAAAIREVRCEQVITTSRMVYMASGTNVLLPKGSRHAFLAGAAGAVYLEFSTPSMDEADRFTDKRVIR
jgi:hypothetical protein